jgi:hypothetical protein
VLSQLCGRRARHGIRQLFLVLVATRFPAGGADTVPIAGRWALVEYQMPWLPLKPKREACLFLRLSAVLFAWDALHRHEDLCAMASSCCLLWTVGIAFVPVFVRYTLWLSTAEIHCHLRETNSIL